MDRLILDVDFNRIEGNHVYSHAGNQGQLYGHIPVVRGHDGKNALYFTNNGGGPADQYVDFGEIPLGNESFSVSLWIRTHRGGCNGWPHPDEAVLTKDSAENAGRRKGQKCYGGVLLSNTEYRIDCKDENMPGFLLANLQPCIYFNTSIRGADSHEDICLWGIKEPDDDRWHQVTVVFDRHASERIFVDGILLKEIDLRSMDGKSIDGGRLILGADAGGCNGLGEMAVSSLRIYRGVRSEDEIGGMYALEDICRIEDELRQRPLPADIYSPEAVRHMRFAAQEMGKKAERMQKLWQADTAGQYLQGEIWRDKSRLAQQMREELQVSYEAFLMNTRKSDVSFLLMSDAHVEGCGQPRALAYGKALSWGRELHMDAFVDCGDYSNYGKAHELDGYWEAVADNRGDMAALVVVGNHETLEKSSSELVAYHTGKLAENQMLPFGYSELYYEYEVCGYHFLVLSQYSDTYTVTGYNAMWVHAADLKEKQINWLEDKLRAYSGQGKPIMLFIHHAIREVVSKQTDGNYRERAVILSSWADAFYKLLEKYPDVVICTGHVHHGFGASCGAFGTRTGYHVIDVPSFCQNKKGYGMAEELGPVKAHTGYVCYIFGNKILLRAVEFENRQWLTAYDELIEIGD